MFRKYFLTAYRSIIQHKTHALINILGLIISLTAVALISLYIHYQLNTDRYHKNLDNIYRIHHQGESAYTSWQLADNLNNKLPEIKHITRIETMYSDGINFKYNNSPIEVKDIIFADSSFMDIFTYNAIVGNLHESLKRPLSIVLNESYSKKIFGKENPLGKEIEYLLYDTSFNLTVTAVIKDIPKNSSLLFNGIISINSYPLMIEGDWPYAWTTQNYETYGLFQENINKDSLENKIHEIVHEAVPERRKEHVEISLNPQKEIYFSKPGNDKCRHGNMTALYILGSTALFILLIAIVNFVNLSIANASMKAGETGLRKVVGALKKHLIFQFLAESIIISAIAVNFALLITNFLLPWFNTISETNINAIQLDSFKTWIIIIVTIISIGLVSGIYPAFYLTQFNPVKTMKGINVTGKGKNRLKNTLITLQFIISIGLIIATIIFFKQLNYIKNKDLGYDAENIIYMKYSPEISNLEVFKEEIQKNPNVIDVAKTFFFPGVGGYQHWCGVEYIQNGEEQRICAVVAVTDASFFKLMDFEIVQGREFSEDMSDADNTCIINEAAVKEFACNEPLKATFFNEKLRVIGVVKDFCKESLHNPPTPLIFRYPKQGYKRYLVIKTKTNNYSSLASTVKYIKKVWEEMSPNYEFTYHFLNETHERHYKAEKQFEKIFFYFSMLSIIIAAMGVLGLVSITTLQRTKEIGIRKANGASIRQIFQLINSDYLKLVLIACIIASPIAWYGMNKWLENFAYKTTISWWIFVLAGLLVALITIITVTAQSYKTAKINPAESLRYE